MHPEAILDADQLPRRFAYYGDAENWLRQACFTYNGVSAALGRLLFRDPDGKWVEIAATPDHTAWNVGLILDEEATLNRLVGETRLKTRAALDRRRSSFARRGQFR